MHASRQRHVYSDCGDRLGVRVGGDLLLIAVVGEHLCRRRYVPCAEGVRRLIDSPARAIGGYLDDGAVGIPPEAPLSLQPLPYCCPERFTRQIEPVPIW